MESDPNDTWIIGITMRKRAFKMLTLEAERLGLFSRKKGSLRLLMIYYAEAMKKQPGQPIELVRKYSRSFRGPRIKKWVELPIWVRDTLRERARRRGFIHGGKGSISYLLNDHAATIQEKYRRLPPDDFQTPIP